MRSLGVDIGGTFTDFLALDDATGELTLFKVPSTPHDPSEAFLTGLDLLAQAGVPTSSLDQCIHGTTVATNTVIQRNGAKTGLITTHGFRDVLEIGRSNRPYDKVYDLQWLRPKPLVERYLRLGVHERADSHGRIVEPLDEDEFVDALDFLVGHGIEALAITFLFSYLNPTNERRALELARERYPDLAVSISSAILPQWREYERTNTTVADAYIKPVMARYLGNLEEGLWSKGFQHELLIMKSNGGVMQSWTAREFPIHTFLSGPAAAVVAAKHIGAQAGFTNLIEMDMGGTSFDVALIDGGEFYYTTEAEIEPTLPVKVAMLDIRTIGAGGGSIAWIDEGGALKVGPKSAGADPGPACYGRGGTDATTTDANLVLGRIDPEYFLGGRMRLQPELAEQAVGRLAQHFGMDTHRMAQGILDITVAKMVQEIRSAAAERGADPRDYVLFAGGGAGPLHAAQIARELGIRRVLVPRAPGLLSAIGLQLSDLRFDSVRTFPCILEHAGTERLGELLQEMVVEGRQRILSESFEAEPITIVSLEMRYERQNWELTIPVDPQNLTVEAVSRAFDREHERLYGFAMPTEYHEIINLRCTTIAQLKDPAHLLTRLVPDFTGADGRPTGTRQIYDDVQRVHVEAHTYVRDNLVCGQQIDGPALITEPDSTIYIPSDCSARVDDYGNILIEVSVR